MIGDCGGARCKGEWNEEFLIYLILLLRYNLFYKKILISFKYIKLILVII